MAAQKARIIEAVEARILTCMVEIHKQMILNVYVT